MIKRIISSIDFRNVFTSIFLNILDIELEKETNIDESKEFNADVWIYLASEGKYKEFIVISINLSTAKNDKEKHSYNEDNPYFEFNNVKYYSIIWINYIYDYCIFHLRLKTINNFFFKIIFKPMKKVYTFEKTEHWIFTTKTTIYRTFVLLLEYLPIYIKERTILDRY